MPLIHRPRRIFHITLSLCLALAAIAAQALLAAPDPKPQPQPPIAASPIITKTFQARDTFAPAPAQSAPASNLLKKLSWKPESFQVTAVTSSVDMDALITFPSPLPSGDKNVDTVRLEWYGARDADGKPIKAPAILLLHEIDRRMPIARILARSIARQGVHAFVMQMPHYGMRTNAKSFSASIFFEASSQAVADARRSRDAIASLPNIRTEAICLQGTSLGGFIAASTAGLDGGYDKTFILLAGANLNELFKNGTRDTANVRKRLEQIGYTGEKLAQLLDQMDPLHLAPRINPKTTYLFSGIWDQVVPAANALALAKAAALPSAQHIWMPADHYTGVLFIPQITRFMVKAAKDIPQKLN